MSNTLPSMLYKDKIEKRQTVSFGGYNHTEGAKDGEIYDMFNMSSDLYPVMSPRKPRYDILSVTTPNGMICDDGIYYVDGTGFYELVNGTPTLRGSLSDSPKKLCSMGEYIFILPDKKIYHKTNHTITNIASARTGSASITNGTYAGKTAAANTIYASGVNWANYFKVGDAVTISGATVHPVNNTTIVVREISGSYLRFYENSFTINTMGDNEANLTVRRDMPDLDFICENENRLWGCKGDTIYASKLGDPFNWNVYDGLSTDSYAVDVGSPGDFTACASYLGYPIFFKEEHIYKVYGSKPSDYQVMSSASLGVETGSDKSIAIAGEVMFYLSRSGIMAYSGGIPSFASYNFGTDRYKNAVGGSDGLKYYVSLEDTSGNHHLFVYDTQKKLWHKEDGTQALAFGWNGELYCLAKTTPTGGKIWLNGNTRTVPSTGKELNVSSYAEFADFVEASPNRKANSKIQIRVELDANSSVSVLIMYDSSGTWETVRTISTTPGETKRSYYLPVIPKRCDHFRLKFAGTGSWRLYSLVRENYIGSEIF